VPQPPSSLPPLVHLKDLRARDRVCHNHQVVAGGPCVPVLWWLSKSSFQSSPPPAIHRPTQRPQTRRVAVIPNPRYKTSLRHPQKEPARCIASRYRVF
jgi:hypothetical protein